MAAPQSPSYVAVQPNSTGEPIDTNLVDYAPLNTNANQPPLVGRQVLVVGDSNVANNTGTVTAGGELRIYDQQVRDLLAQILVQLQISNALNNLEQPPQNQQNLTQMAAAFFVTLNLPN